MKTKEIPLTRGQVALVDEADYEWLSRFKWCAAFRNNSFYAQCSHYENGIQRTIYMHRLILGIDGESKRYGDHANRNTLDNQRCNLRIATPGQNQANTRPRSACGLKGSYFRKDSGRWQAQIGVNGRLKSLGCYSTAELAHAAYRVAAEQYHGEFARFE